MSIPRRTRHGASGPASGAGPSSTTPSFSTSGDKLASSSTYQNVNKAKGKSPAPPARLDEDNTSDLSQSQLRGLRRQSNLSTISLSPKRPSSSTATARPQRKSRFAPREDESVESIIMGEETVEGEAQEDFTMVDRMRNWRNDAMTQHLYGTAQFWGSKVFGLTGQSNFSAFRIATRFGGRIADLLRPTGNPNDAFWLAQTHLLTHQYSQAERILTTLRPTTPPSTEFASSSTPPPGSPSSSSQNGEMRRLTDTSLACRYLAAQCQVRLGKWEEALEMVGRGNGNWSAWDGEIDQGDGPGDGGIKVRCRNSTRSLRKFLTRL